tara:strand:+ start:159 stop:353 length:195 start_codon:yes stop_codon:yes gene_type:complete
MSFLHKLSPEERRILRVVIKTVHLKHYPKDFITDYEADKLMAVIAPETLEHLKKTGKDFGVVDL